jgi:hypothetical protein
MNNRNEMGQERNETGAIRSIEILSHNSRLPRLNLNSRRLNLLIASSQKDACPTSEFPLPRESPPYRICQEVVTVGG